MDNLKQITDIVIETEQKKNRSSAVIAGIIIAICLVATVIILITRFVVAPTALEAPPSDPPEAVSTPAPAPTPSLTDGTKLDETAPADLTRVLMVNGPEAAEKTAYLTFDDGPSENTVMILDTLDLYGAKATFFVVGTTAEKNPEILKMIHDRGHSIGNHTYSHDYEIIYESPELLLDDLRKNEELIGSIIGPENILKLFRFPGGSFGEKRQPFRDAVASTEYKYVDWNALNSDADGNPFSHERSLEEVKTHCEGKGDVIILMHDTAAKTITAESLPQILEYLSSQGYKFERIVP